MRAELFMLNDMLNGDKYIASKRWYLDSCANVHVNKERGLFVFIRGFKTLFSTAAGEVRAFHTGNVDINLHDSSKNTIFVAGVDDVRLLSTCERKLLSVSKLFQAGHKVDFINLVLTFKDGYSCDIIQGNGLYYIQSYSQHETIADGDGFISEASTSFNTPTSRSLFYCNDKWSSAGLFDHWVNFPIVSSAVCLATEELVEEEGGSLQTPPDSYVLHARFGHFSHRYIKSLQTQEIDIGFGVSDVASLKHRRCKCLSCSLAKITRPHFAAKSNAATPAKCGDILFTDIQSIPTLSIGRYLYAIHFTDGCSR